MHLWHNVLTMNNDGCSFGCAQRHVQNRAIFRNVDRVAAEHSVDSLTQP